MRRREFVLLAASMTLFPVGAPAQQKRLPVIGYLHFDDRSDLLHEAFLRGLKTTGYVPGQNVAIEYRWAEGQNEKAAVADLVGRNVDMLVAFGPPLARAAKEATSIIPIVFEVGNDAVEAGLVASLSRPGGNATGINVLFTQLTPKLLEIISEIVPRIRVVGLLVNPRSPTAQPTMRIAEKAAQEKGVQLSVQQVSAEREIEAAFTALAALGADALIVGPDPFFGNQRARLIEHAARVRFPRSISPRDLPWPVV